MQIKHKIFIFFFFFNSVRNKHWPELQTLEVGIHGWDWDKENLQGKQKSFKGSS